MPPLTTHCVQINDIQPARSLPCLTFDAIETSLSLVVITPTLAKRFPQLKILTSSITAREKKRGNDLKGGCSSLLWCLWDCMKLLDSVTEVGYPLNDRNARWNGVAMPWLRYNSYNNKPKYSDAKTQQKQFSKHRIKERQFHCSRSSSHLTFGQISNENSVVIGRFLFSDTYLRGVAHVTTHVGKKLYSGVDLTFEETKQRVLDVVNCALQCNQCLQKTSNRFKNSRSRTLQRTS